MKPFVLAAIVALAAPVGAQSAPQKLVPGVFVAPEAQKRLDAVVGKLKGLKSLSYRFTTTFASPNGPYRQPLRAVSWHRPNLARVDRLSQKQPVLERLNDGKTLYLASVDNEYQSLPLENERNQRMAINIIQGAGYSSGNMVIYRALNGQSLAEVLRRASLPHPQRIEISALPVTLVNGLNLVGVRVKRQPLKTSSQVLQREQTFWFGENDGLIYRVQERRVQKGRWVSMSEDFFAYALNPTFAPDTFQFDATGKTVVSAEEAERTWDARLKVGAAPFAFEAKALNGALVSPESLKGKVVLLDFWATWCGPCIGELPNLQRVYNRHKKDGFEIIGISLDEDKSALTDFVRARKIGWPQLFDGKGWQSQIAAQFGVKAIPFTLLMGRDGKIAALNLSGAELETAVKAALER